MNDKNGFDEYMKSYEEHEIFTFMLNAKKSLEQIDVKDLNRFSLVFGNEAAGLGTEFENIGTSVIIQHSKNIDSLNLAVAVGIAEYEIFKNLF